MSVRTSRTRAGRTYSSFRIIQKIMQSGPMTRNELADSLDMTNAMALNRVNELIDKGILSFAGFETKISGDTIRGRYNQLVDLNPACCFAISVTVMKGKITVLITTMKLLILEKATVDLNEENIDTAVSQIYGIIDRLATNSCLDRDRIVGISVAIGPDYWKKFGGRLHDCSITANKFSEKLERLTGYKVYIMTIATAAALYQFNRLCDSSKDFALVYVDITNPSHFAGVSYDVETSHISTFTRNLANAYIRGGEAAEKPIRKFSEIFSVDSDIDDILASGKCSCPERIREIKNLSSEEEKRQKVYRELCNGERGTKYILRKKVNEFIVFLYNVATFVGADKVIIANTTVDPLMSKLLTECLDKIFDDRERQRFIVSEDPLDYVYLGNAFTVFARGFSEFYAKL